MFANYHTHTPRCRHAIGEEREYIENAIKAGMKILGFSDHSPQVFDDGFESYIRMTPEEACEYVSKLRGLAEEYKDDINILVGFEAEYYPDIFYRLRELSRELKIDYLILGQHCLESEPLNLWSTVPRSENKWLTKYVDNVICGMSTEAFTYLAHPDVIRFTGDKEFYKVEMTRLCRAAKAFSVPLEVNMLGLADGRHYPSDRFYRIAAEVGNELVIGCDAHEPSALLDLEAQKKTREFAEKYGLNILETVELKKI